MQARARDPASVRADAGPGRARGHRPADDYESSNFPFSFVIDGKGQIRGSYRGYKPECAGKLEQDIRTQLEQLR